MKKGLVFIFTIMILAFIGSAIILVNRANQQKAESTAVSEMAGREMQEAQEESYKPLRNMEEKYLSGFKVNSPSNQKNE